MLLSQITNQLLQINHYFYQVIFGETNSLWKSYANSFITLIKYFDMPTDDAHSFADNCHIKLIECLPQNIKNT